MKRSRGSRAALSAAALAAVLVVAGTPAEAQQAGFESTLEAYLMGAGMSGTAGAGSVSTGIDVPASSVFENLKFAALLDYRGQSPKWAIAADVVYMNLGGSGEGPLARSSADVGAEELIVDLVGAYRVSPAFEVLAGGRYTNLTTTVKLTTPIEYREDKGSKGWLDPVIGAQVFVPLSARLELQLRGDIGGFGVGCDFTWQATVRVNWMPSPALKVGVGYRFLDQDYETGSGSDYFKWNVLTQGPMAAVGVRF